MSEPQEVDDEVIVKISDYLDGALEGAERSEVAKRIETDTAWKQTDDEMGEQRKVMSGMRKAKAPETSTTEVTETRHRRSAGRCLGRKTLGDRVPFNALLILALIAMVVVGSCMWSPPTGSLKVEEKAAPTDQPSAPI